IITAFLMAFAGITGPVAVGLYCGATTNTPSLAAAGQALRDYPPDEADAQAALGQVAPQNSLVRTNGPLSDSEHEQLFSDLMKLPAMAYAVSYPGGVFGIIVAILVLRWIFRIDPIAESEMLESQNSLATPALSNLYVRVT